MSRLFQLNSFLLLKISYPIWFLYLTIQVVYISVLINQVKKVLDLLGLCYNIKVLPTNKKGYNMPESIVREYMAKGYTIKEITLA